MSKDRHEGPRGPLVLPLGGAEKVTALLLSMGKSLADRVIRNFDDSEIRTLARAASKLQALAPEDIEHLVDELERSLKFVDPLVGSTAGAQQLIAGVVSEDMESDIMSELDGTAPERVWLKLRTVDDSKISAFVARERPQVAAFILSKLPPAKASAVLETLDLGLSTDLSRRLLALKPIGLAAQHMIAERLGQELLATTGIADSGAVANRHAQLGTILNQLERSQIDRILDGLAREVPDDARRVRDYVFGFEDIAVMPTADRVKLFEEVPSERVIVALRDCMPELRDVVLTALSPRARRMVEAELSAPAQVDAKAIADSRRAIAALALDMAGRGLIRLRADEPAGAGP